MVAPALLHLVQVAQRPSLIRMEPRNQAPAETAKRPRVGVGMFQCHAKRLVARPFLDPIHAIVVYIRRIAKDAQRHAEEGVAQPPVTMVVVPVAFARHRVMPPLQEVLCRREPHVNHVLLEQLEFLLSPGIAAVVAHQLGGIDKLVARESGNQGNVRVAAQGRVPRAPSIQRLRRTVGIRRVTRDFPHQGALVSIRRATIGIHVILSRDATDNRARHGHVPRRDDAPRIA